MMICKDCYVPMIGVISFSQDKHEKFERYPKCFCETKHQNSHDDELTFREILQRELHKRK